MGFFRKSEPGAAAAVNTGDFGYLEPGAHYFDTACQTLRPRPVIAAMTEYFEHYNACGGRVKYAWGEKTDSVVNGARKKLLALLNKSEKEYAAAFCLNTTAGINLVIQQLPAGRYQRVVTSEIEHNSVFLPAQTVAKRLGIERLVLPRQADGSLDYRPEQLERAVVVVNATSNIDGRMLRNVKELVTETHKRGGAVIIDAAQTMAHSPELLRDAAPDAICGSAHKMYGPSLGFIVIRKEFLKSLECFFIGGGTVSDVRRDDYDLIDDPEEPWARLEPGLQDFVGIAGFGAAIDWMSHYKPEGHDYHRQQSDVARVLYESLRGDNRIVLLNHEPSPILSFHCPQADGHRLALYLSAQNIMVRSGYFCCHYYLQRVAQLPPQVRLSIGLHNTVAEAQEVADIIRRIVKQL